MRRKSKSCRNFNGAKWIAGSKLKIVKNDDRPRRAAVVAYVGCEFSDGEVCTEETLAKMLESAQKAMGTIALLKDHSWAVENILGYADAWDINDGNLIASFIVSDETAQMIDNGIYKNVSVAFSIPDYEIQEVSIVAVPAVRGARFVETVNENEEDDEEVEIIERPEEIERVEIVEEPEEPEDDEEDPEKVEIISDNEDDEEEPEEDKKIEILQNALKYNNRIFGLKSKIKNKNQSINSLKKQLKQLQARESKRLRYEQLAEIGRRNKLPENIKNGFAMFCDDLSDKKFFEFLDIYAELRPSFGGARISKNTAAMQNKLEVDDLEKRFNKIFRK